MLQRVVWALAVTMDSRCPRKALNSVDLPAFGRPDEGDVSAARGGGRGRWIVGWCAQKSVVAEKT